MTTEKILDKLQKIKAHAESAAAIGSEAEAQAFAEMLNRLLVEHKLEMSDLEFERQDATNPVDQALINFSDEGVKVRRTRVSWIEKLASLVARNHCCRILVHPGSSNITLVGRREDRAVAEYMIVTLVRATESMSKKEHQKYCWQVYQRDGNCSAARGFKEAFITGFIRRLFDRFEEIKRQRESETNTSTGLMRISKDDAAAEAFVEALKPKKATALARLEVNNGEGYRRGVKAADSVNLKANAIGSTNTTPRAALK